ncbi:MAG: hypothetical protein ACRC10_09120 [Thermoguttaceae bacterium]
MNRHCPNNPTQSVSRRTVFQAVLGCGLIALLISTAGCQAGLFTLAYLWKGRDVDPEYDILKKGEIKVAVVCRTSAMDQYQNETVPRDITRQVAKLIKQNVKNKKLTVIDYRKVEQYLDDCSHNFEDFDEVGDALKADVVIGIELQNFYLQDSPNLLQGRAGWMVKTFDMRKQDLYAQKVMSVVYPPNVPLPVRDNTSVPAFRMKFVDVISKQIAALYHPHDPNRIYGLMDADLLEMH